MTRYGFRYQVNGLALAIKLEWSHWTSEGTIQVFATLVMGWRLYAIYFRGIELGLENSITDATKAIRTGKYDEAAGLGLSGLGIPEDVEQWNGWTMEPFYHIPYD
jgi:hypothetical protein